jgi:hypothetical protein
VSNFSVLYENTFIQKRGFMFISQSFLLYEKVAKTDAHIVPKHRCTSYMFKLYRLHHVVYIVRYYLCYSRQHNKQCGDIFNNDNRFWYMSYLFNVNATCATCFDHIIRSSSGSYEHCLYWRYSHIVCCVNGYNIIKSHVFGSKRSNV